MSTARPSLTSRFRFVTGGVPAAVDQARPALTGDDVTGSSPYRRYRARASDVWVLCPREPGQPCPPHGLAKDHRVRTNVRQ